MFFSVLGSTGLRDKAVFNRSARQGKAVLPVALAPPWLIA